MLKDIKYKKLESSLLRKMLEDNWFAPNDAYLRTPEVFLWQELKKSVSYPLLNIGCGDGVMDMNLFRGYKKHTGLDNNPESIERARSVTLYEKVVLSGAENMPFKDGQFKTVISNSTFEHIKKDKEAVSEVSRVLKKGGSLFFNTTSNDLYKVLIEKMSRKEMKKFNDRLAHYHYRSLDEWTKLLKSSDMKLEEYLFYHPKNNIEVWLNLYRFATFIPYKREMWSYLRDSRISPIMPKKAISEFWYQILKRSCSRSFEGKGKWLFMVARKI